jgi:hypothetical protein
MATIISSALLIDITGVNVDHGDEVLRIAVHAPGFSIMLDMEEAESLATGLNSAIATAKMETGGTR